MLIATSKPLLLEVPPRPAQFIGRCSLCGMKCEPSALYCRAHSWAVRR